MDCFSIKPIDDEAIPAAAATTGRIVVAEDHRAEGGLGSAVKDSLIAAGRATPSLVHLAVRGMPGSGSRKEQLAWAGIDADHFASAARSLARG
ncbi:transketolase C-terminal domain-containing protein [Micromonospora sp. URMC 103]|uniref:transketolase C-terminal domain-containing protein n=1 Tax=Micromonospora sp. URMC 103 TaxID=3423406 RepID=UPI003F1B7D04